jgi:hypothetical protein
MIDGMITDIEYVCSEDVFTQADKIAYLEQVNKNLTLQIRDKIWKLSFLMGNTSVIVRRLENVRGDK